MKTTVRRIKNPLRGFQMRRLAFALQMAAAISFFSCGINQTQDISVPGSGSGQKKQTYAFGPSGDKGLFRAYLTDFPIGNSQVSKVLVSIEKIEIHSDERGWITVADYPQGRIYNLLDLQNGKTEDLGELSLEPGKYTQVRIIVGANNQIEVDEGAGPVLKPLKIPSGAQTGIKLVHPFEVPIQGVTTLTLDFNAQQSITKAGSKYNLKPTIKVIGSETTPGFSKMVSAANGGELNILGKIKLSVPPGALGEDTRIEIVPTKAQYLPELFGSYIQLPDVYDLKPDGLKFNTNAEITMHYNEQDILALGIDEVDLTPLYYDVKGGYWQDMEGQVMAATNTIVFPTNHFTNFGTAHASRLRPNIRWATINTLGGKDANGNSIGVPLSITAKVVPTKGQTITDVVVYYRHPLYFVDPTAATKIIKYDKIYLKPVGGNSPFMYEGTLHFPANSPSFSDFHDTAQLLVYAEAHDTGFDAGTQKARMGCAPRMVCDPQKRSNPYVYTYDGYKAMLDTDIPAGTTVYSDLWANYYEINIANDLASDFDLDGKTNQQEYEKGTNPRLSDLQSNYWEQRLHLLNRLVEVGTGHGKSLVSSGTESYTTRLNYATSNGYHVASNLDFMTWGDTLLKQGWYLGVLATEYKRLRLGGTYKDSLPTLYELYFALRALERMDYYAEHFHSQIHTDAGKATEWVFSNLSLNFVDNTWPSSKSGTNGFLMRDDMTQEAYENYYAIKPVWAELPPYGYSEAMGSEGKNLVGSNDGAKFIPPTQGLRGYEPSQDHYTHLYMGLALVVKYIPANATVNGESIKEMAQRIENRIYNSFLAHAYSYYGTIIPYSGYGVSHVRNPVTGLYVHTGENIWLGAQQLCVTHIFIQTGWYSHEDKYRCLWVQPIDHRPLANIDKTFFNRAMASQVTSYSNWDDESSYGRDDNTLTRLNSYLFTDVQDTWYDAEEVFGMVNVALYNKPYNFYSRGQIGDAMSRIRTRGNRTYTYDHNVLTKIPVAEGRLELMLMNNLYQITYNDLGFTSPPPKEYVNELTRHLARSQNVIDVNTLPWVLP